MPSQALTFHLIPHVHWDREWYLTRGRFGARLVRMIDQLVELLNQEPGIPGFLLDGQTVLLDDYLRVRPDQKPLVEALVRSGRIETGPWYVLSDEQIPSGESLIRNLLLGRADTARLGRGMDVLYSPDAFGHPAILPMLAREFGLAAAVAWRGLPGRDDADLFRWSAPNGASVVLYQLPREGYEIGSALPSDTKELKSAWAAMRKSLVARAGSEHVAVLVGADHHFARTDLVLLRDRLAGLEPANEVRLSRLQDFMDLVRDRGGAYPALSGEQRWSYGYTWTLQDVHSTRAPLKRRNSLSELWLERYAEPLAVLAAGNQKPLLATAWRTLVQCHFHDALGGCCADEVALEVDSRLSEVDGTVREMVRDSFNRLVGHDPDAARDRPGQVSPSLVLWNPAARTRSGLVLTATTWFRRDVLVGPPGGRRPRVGNGYQPFVLATPTGGLIPVQVLEIVAAQERLDADRHYPDQDDVDLVRIAFKAPAVPGLGVLELRPVAGGGRTTGPHARVVRGKLCTDAIEVEPDRDGSARLRDLRSGREFSNLFVLEDETDEGDTYTFSPSPLGGVKRLRPGRTRVIVRGPLVAARETKWSGPGIDARLRLMVNAYDPVVRGTLEVNNRASNHRLRIRFPTGIPGIPALAGAQLGVIERGAVGNLKGNHESETPARTAPAHRFVAVRNGDGLGLCCPGFFEYELTQSGDLLLTVLRSVGALSRNDLATRPGHAGWPTPTPLAQCHGMDRIDFALAPLTGKDDAASLHRIWEDCFLPVRGTWFRDWLPHALPETTGIELSGDGLALSSLKPAEQGDGVVVRCFNLRDQEVEGTVRSGRKLSRAQLARADETRLQDLPLGKDGRSVSFPVAAQGLATLVLEQALGGD